MRVAEGHGRDSDEQRESCGLHNLFVCICTVTISVLRSGLVFLPFFGTTRPQPVFSKLYFPKDQTELMKTGCCWLHHSVVVSCGQFC